MQRAFGALDGGQILNNSDFSLCKMCIRDRDGTVKSVVYIFDFNQEEPKAKFEFSDNLLLSIRCLESGNVAAIGNRGASIMIPAAQEKIDYDYQGKTLSTFQLDPYYGMVLALAQSEDGRNCTVVRIDNQGKTAMELSLIHI